MENDEFLQNELRKRDDEIGKLKSRIISICIVAGIIIFIVFLWGIDKRTKYNELLRKHGGMEIKYEELQDNYTKLQEGYKELKSEYDDLESGKYKPRNNDNDLEFTDGAPE